MDPLQIILSINLGLLTSIGVVSSLLSISTRSIMRQRVLYSAIILFGVSAFLAIVSISTILQFYLLSDNLYVHNLVILTEISIILFGLATLILLYLVYDLSLIHI